MNYQRAHSTYPSLNPQNHPSYPLPNTLTHKGYIKEVKDPKDIKEAKSQGICWFPVVHKNGDTTKVRVVFDAASANREGKSVNSEVEKTPNRLNDLFKILLRFRQYEFALQA
jgi:hypothetical protein